MLDDRPYMRAEYHGERPQGSVTRTLLIINVVVFFLEILYIGRDAARADFINQTFALSLRGLLHGYVWQLVTYQFMHAGILHLVMNCLVLYFVGRHVEVILGRSAFKLVYFGGGIMGGLLQVLAGLIPAVGGAGVVGASGSLMSLLGVFCWMFWRERIQLLLMFVIPVTVTGKTMFFVLLGFDLLGIVSQQGNLAHFAHIGGLLTGFQYMRMGRRYDLSDLPGVQAVGNWFKKRSSGRQSSGPRYTATPFRNRPNQSEDFMSSEVDPILDKISAHGIHSLTAEERAILEKAQKKMARR